MEASTRKTAIVELSVEEVLEIHRCLSLAVENQRVMEGTNSLKNEFSELYRSMTGFYPGQR